jgi:hypothetical protein
MVPVAFQLVAGAGAGLVFTSDASGNASWAALLSNAITLTSADSTVRLTQVLTNIDLSINTTALSVNETTHVVATKNNTIDDGAGKATFTNNVVIGTNDAASPPTSLTIGSATNTVSIAGNTYPTKMQTHQEGNDTIIDIGIGRHSNNADVSGNLYILRSEGTEAAKLAVKNGDDLGTFYVLGYDGSTYQTSFYMDTVVDAAVSSGIVPVTVTFGVTDTTGADNGLLVLNGSTKTTATLNNTLDDGTGNLTTSGSVSPGSNAKQGTASHIFSGTGVPSSLTGMVAGDFYFRVDGSHVQGTYDNIYNYDGSAWVGIA